MEVIRELQGYFSEHLRAALLRANALLCENAQEIRLRVGRPLAVTVFGRERFVTENGSVTDCPQLGLLVTAADLDYSFKASCNYSVHSYSRELKNGFVTIAGGHRVGICGTAVFKDGEIDTMKQISGLNFRIARQVIGCANGLVERLFCGKPSGLLIIGEPVSGKTTVLRDLCRQLGNTRRLSIIDERGELAATYQGLPQNGIGYCSDVFDGYSKSEGILTAIRVMSPEIIVLDEIGSAADALAIEQGINAGVSIIATAHAASFDEILGRSFIRQLLFTGAFGNIALLGSGKMPGKIQDIRRVNDIVQAYRNTIDCGGKQYGRRFFIEATGKSGAPVNACGADVGGTVRSDTF